MADRSQISRILLVLSSLPNCPVKDGNLEFVIDTYHLVLKDVEGDVLNAAAAQYLSTGTFFPTPGQLRRTTIELRLHASGIPTAAEAWGDVLGAVRHVEATYCREGARLRNQALDADKAGDGAGYTSALRGILGHSRICRECRDAHTIEVYCHPAVEQTVRRLGGRAALFTENLAADRARFLEAYEEILGRAVVEASRLPEVANWLESDRNAEVKRLAEKMRG